MCSTCGYPHLLELAVRSGNGLGPTSLEVLISRGPRAAPHLAATLRHVYFDVGQRVFESKNELRDQLSGLIEQHQVDRVPTASPSYFAHSRSMFVDDSVVVLSLSA